MEASCLSLDDRIKEKFRCCICLELPDPETAICHGVCGHVFCFTCLSTAISASPECPLCRRPMHTLPGNIKSENHLVYCLMAELPTECPCKLNGCPWKGERTRLASHLSECPYVIVEPDFGCGRPIISSEACQPTSECPRSSLACKYCGMTFAADDLESHQEKCANDTRSCPFQAWGCGWCGRRSELTMHLDCKHDRINGVKADEIKEELKHEEAPVHIEGVSSDMNSGLQNEPPDADADFLQNIQVFAKAKDSHREEVKMVKAYVVKPKKKPSLPQKKEKVAGGYRGRHTRHGRHSLAHYALDIW